MTSHALNGRARRIFPSHPRRCTHGHKSDTIEAVQGGKKKKKGGGPLFPFLSASLTHCLHNSADSTHTHAQTLSSPGHDCVLSDSSECAPLTSVYSSVCLVLSTSACVVIELSDQP